MRQRGMGSGWMAGVVLVAFVAGVLVACGRDDPPLAGGGGAADAADGKQAVQAFFDQYLDGDGRVVRRDQGGDTVSEGQAYGLLLAVATGDRQVFDRIWEWTRTHLQRSDGLLSWHWADGRVVDDSPAADADVDTARALVLAGRRFDAPGLTAEGVRLSAAILDRETVRAGDHLVLAAGPWAVERRIANPSYLAPCAFAELHEATGDGRWGQLRAGVAPLVQGLVGEGLLPPDWASIEDGSLRAIGTPDEPGATPRYGLDANRLPFRLAECDGEGRRLASGLWDRLRTVDGQGGAIAYDLEGNRVDDNDHATGLVGAAGAAHAAGDTTAAGRLLDRAAAQDRRHPTYYGAAWVALGRTYLAGEGSGA